MTYDLTFYRRKDGSQLSEERLLEFFRKYPNISCNKHQAGYDFDYENKITQVYFQIPYKLSNSKVTKHLNLRVWKIQD